MLALVRFVPELNLAALRDRVGLMLATHRQRVALRDLPPHLLADVGLTADLAAREAARAPWDVSALR